MSDIKINGILYGSSDSANITYKDTSVYNKLEELSAGNLSAININYDNTKSGLDATNMQNAVDEVAIMVNGLVVSVTADSWNLSNDGTYKKIIAIEQLTGNETLDVCLYPGDTHTDEQIIAFSELITSIETNAGGITLTATEAITVSFRILLYGKINFDKDNLVALSDSVLEIKSISEEDFEKKSDAEKADGNFLVDDGEDDEFLSARNIEFDGSELGMDVDNVQDAISELNSKTEHVDFKREDWSKITLNRYSGKPSLEFTRPDADEKYTLRMTNNGMDFLLNDSIVASTTLVTQKFKTDTIASLSDNRTLSVNVTKSGYTPIGVVSYNIGGGSYISLVNLYRLNLSGNKVDIAIAPLSGTATNIYVEFTVLYVKSN